MLPPIIYLDIEVGTTSHKIEQLGIVIGNNSFKTSSLTDIKERLLSQKIKFICGHNFIDFDSKYLINTILNPIISKAAIIDTLYLSMLLFPSKKTHKLNKPYKDNEITIVNDPSIDAEETQALFELLDKNFNNLDNNIQNIYYKLLGDHKYFSGFFEYKKLQGEKYNSIDIYPYIKNKIVVDYLIYNNIEKDNSLELAFIISFLYQKESGAISKIVLKKYPNIVGLLKSLTFNSNQFDIQRFSKDELGIDNFREFDNNQTGLNYRLFEAGKISQIDIIKSALNGQSLLAVLPTGGGKSIAFQIPALIKAQAHKGLTVVISPLQALMKDQIAGFKRKNNNFKVVAISGFLSPPERANAIYEVENGVVDIVYLAPESLRSNSIFKVLQQRVIERFVIDEAHCLSAWGHDFRHDYYFIANTILELEKDEFQPTIPVSCFTATAKPEVIKEIEKYFKDKLTLTLHNFIASVERYNLEYEVISVETQNKKERQLINILIERKKNPTIIYIPQNAKVCRELSKTLNQDERLSTLDLIIEPFYARLNDDMDNGSRAKDARNKEQILTDFIDNKIDIVIATTAFGMGIDKADIQTIIHYQQSDSLESYLQESGRGARKEGLTAKCIVLYAKDDFNQSFLRLNRTKVEAKEIQLVVKVLQQYKRDDLFISAKDIAKKMGIDTNDAKIDYDVIVKTALLELEKHNIIIRYRDKYKIYATSILNKGGKKINMQHIKQVLDKRSALYKDMVLVMQNVIQRSKLNAIESDDLADIVGIERKRIFEVLNELQENKLLSFENDISVAVKASVKRDFKVHFSLEKQILDEISQIHDYEKSIDLRQFNNDYKINNIALIKQIIQSWNHLEKIAQLDIFSAYFKHDTCYFNLDKKDENKLKKLINSRENICEFIVAEILSKLGSDYNKEIELSIGKIKQDYNKSKNNHNAYTIGGFHHAIVYLHDMLKSFELRTGRLIYHHNLSLQKQQSMQEKTPYKIRDNYNPSLKPYYERKIESIHIHIAFLEKVLSQGWHQSKAFIKDYFSLDYIAFKKYYGFNDKDIKQAITKERRIEIIKHLNTEQQYIFDDDKSQSIMVLAGPGSGKTWVLVRKIASLITIENNKAEYFLMLAHSRVAVAEFKQRLKDLIGNRVYDLRICTFHSFALNLLGKNISSNSDFDDVIKQATDGLKNSNLSLPLISMLVLDEYQDVGKNTYNFIKTIYSKMTVDKKIIAVGDDDQCINNFSGDNKADVKYIRDYKHDFNISNENNNNPYSQYELLTNYRSKYNLVEFTNLFSNHHIKNRLKNNNIKAYTNKNGVIKITKYKYNYYHNILNHIKNNNAFNIALLARTNDEVLTLYSMLVSNNIQAKYIADSDGFELGNLIELQDFLMDWQQNKNLELSKKNSDDQYQKSSNNALKNEVIEKFEQEYSDEIDNNYAHRLFKQYLQQIKFEEFNNSKNRVTVSTMHKAKGKEWDDVYICFQSNFIDNSEYNKRLAYVAMTRAKTNLYIHTKIPLFDDFKPYCDEYTFFNKQSGALDKIIFLMGLKDIQLSNEYSQKGFKDSQPIAGETVAIKDDYSYISLHKNNKQIATLSNSMIEKIRNKQQQGYQLEKAVIKHIVQWEHVQQEHENGERLPQVLCELYLKKTAG